MYNASLKYKWDNKNVMDYAKAEGKARGIAEGKAEGRAEGRAEGLLEGERKKAVEMALKLKAKNIRVDEISEITELSIEDIEAL